MRDELLALLEDGAHSAAQLAEWLEQPRMTVTRTLAAMAVAGQVKTIGTAKHWALVSYRPRLGRRPGLRRDRVPGTSDEARAMEAYNHRILATSRSPQRRHRATRMLENLSPFLEPPPAAAPVPTVDRRKAADVVTDRLLLIEEPPALGDGVCERCGARFWRDRGVERPFCSRACESAPPASDIVIRIIDGVEYEAQSIGARPLTHWPDDGLRGGSSLSGQTFGVKR